VPKRKPKDDDYFLCSYCGAELPLTATFCRHCGASDECGWGEDENKEDLDLSAGYCEDDDAFDYDEFIAEEFPDQAPQEASKLDHRFQLACVVLLCIGLLASVVLYVCH
jgi:hypothetical protein